MASMTSKLPLPSPRSQVSLPHSQPTNTVIPLQPAQLFQPVRSVKPALFGLGMNIMSPGCGTTSTSHGLPIYNSSPPSYLPCPLHCGEGAPVWLLVWLKPTKPATSANFNDLWNLSLGSEQAEHERRPCQIDEVGCGDFGCHQPEPEQTADDGWGIVGTLQHHCDQHKHRETLGCFGLVTFPEGCRSFWWVLALSSLRWKYISTGVFPRSIMP